MRKKDVEGGFAKVVKVVVERRRYPWPCGESVRSRAIKKAVTVHCVSSLSRGRVCSAYAVRAHIVVGGSVVERDGRVRCTCVDVRTWMVAARLPRYRSSWPPRVMPYPLALHNNLPRRVCSGISTARTTPWTVRFSPREPLCPFAKVP